ncbi:hypothetical protein APTSU1_000462100 [Apodemus speciosus]|uniref:Uncharacterized protein n=1 Tax=Apodemus speciosus TaxID=105296 RepID=A0ABQ0ERF4_APOSI
MGPDYLCFVCRCAPVSSEFTKLILEDQRTLTLKGISGIGQAVWRDTNYFEID